ncbi:MULTISPECIES: 2TM domain-containing protein [unclassified Flavobacterium]|uniref:2TM domain-containing protein n=1 Tax=unclassified Flavobacterium TaxID=196869 RepID=UPI000959494F|nr:MULTISPECIES: 2TM domain-containing protein [unclassified Flavobacterium]MBN9282930.1 2TM domain-containing protein [Flavobacterium sp.]OJV67568.1 MAG: histidine kinase [Flavobacterium sp. 40-81]
MNKYLKHFFRSLIIGVIIFLVMFFIQLIIGVKIAFDDKLLLVFECTVLYSVALYMANMAVFIGLDRIFVKDRFSPKRIFIGFFGSFAVSLGTIFLLRIFEEVVLNKLTLDAFLEREKAGNYLVAIVITFIVTIIIHAIYFYRSYQENRVKQQKIIAGTASAKFESLKNQIDPHFLFNSLNVLSSLIEENPDNAQRFTASLSKIYRYVLEQRDKELVSIDEELAFAKTYMNLLKMRFENSLFYEHPEQLENPDGKVVPLSLQLLLENTIKHNVVSEKKPLHIRIYEQDNCLVVQNDFQKKEVLKDRQGVGLQNIINRYAILTDRKVKIEQTDKDFIVRLPMLTKQVGIMETYQHHDDSAYYRAKKKVEAIKGFYGNMISYCLVIPTLVFINLTFSSQFQWFWFPMLGWGMGLFIHGFSVFGYGASWEERKIRELMDKQDNDSRKNWK